MRVLQKFCASSQPQMRR